MTKLEEIKLEHIDYKKVGSLCSNCLSKKVVCKISFNEHCCKTFVKVNSIYLCSKCFKKLKELVNDD